ncbi:hypothetical protein [uncultured Aquimarina sp.]|uniref:hypothetical protein n=1 Tax=uncultured Aquimarina sp. TaxID=575652 RepID=UPI00262CA95E|nr:hypothetical protein [uncultured Aquimarina sp.]
MKYITHKPYIIFWSLIPILLIYGFSFSKETLKINMYDTYFVIYWSHFFTFLSILFLGIGLLYFTIHKLNKKRRSLLSNIHVISTITATLVFIFTPLLSISKSTEKIEEAALIVRLISLVTIIVAQPILFLYLIISVFQKK